MPPTRHLMSKLQSKIRSQLNSVSKIQIPQQECNSKVSTSTPNNTPSKKLIDIMSLLLVSVFKHYDNAIFYGMEAPVQVTSFCMYCHLRQ